MRLPLFPALSVAALLLAGCVSNSQQASNSEPNATFQPQATAPGAPTPLSGSTATAVKTSPAPAASAARASAPAASSSRPAPRTSLPSAASQVGTDYRLSPLDVVEISVFQVPDLTKTVEVNARGEIALPLIGTVQAGGKTTSELEREIAAKLEQNYLQSAQVSVFVKEYRSQKVTVEGAVNGPGVYEIPGQSSLLQVLAMAKGLDRVGDPNGVIVFRNQDGQRMAAVFNVDAIRKGQQDDPVILAGDTVVVDESQGRAMWRNIRESAGVAALFRPTF
ncbi:polysaccharide export outer membrane protein [Amorphus suaedae]